MTKESSPFEVYTDMFRAWGDVFSSWAKSISGMPSYGPKEMESWFRPFWDYFKDWDKMYGTYMDSMKGFPWPYGAMKDYTDTMMKGINSYVKIYDAWVRSMDRIGRKQLETAQGLAAGKEVNTTEIFDVLRESYDDVYNSLTESLKGTAFEEVFKGVEEVNKVVKRFADSFPEEQKQARETFQTFSNSFVKMTNSWSASMTEAARTFSDMLSKGEISSDVYKKLMDTFGEASKESVGVLLGPLSSLFPEYKDMVDDMTDWANKYFDLLASWIEVPVKLSQGIGKSSSEMYKFTDEMFRGGKISSPDEFSERASEFYRKATADLMEAAQFTTTLPKFTGCLIEYIKSTNNLYRRIMTPPFPSKEEMDKVYERMESVRKTAERRRAGRKEEADSEG